MIVYWCTQIRIATSTPRSDLCSKPSRQTIVVVSCSEQPVHSKPKAIPLMVKAHLMTRKVATTIWKFRLIHRRTRSQLQRARKRSNTTRLSACSWEILCRPRTPTPALKAWSAFYFTRCAAVYATVTRARNKVRKPPLCEGSPSGSNLINGVIQMKTVKWAL